jgi:hypothetical protein
MGYRIVAAGALAAVTLLSACQGTDFERAAMGAGGGALAANVMGGDMATGALIGGVVGATCDNITTLCR